MAHTPSQTIGSPRWTPSVVFEEQAPFLSSWKAPRVRRPGGGAGWTRALTVGLLVADALLYVTVLPLLLS